MLWNAAQDYPGRRECKEKMNSKKKRERKQKLGIISKPHCLPV
jgi:hypothetical protein